MSNPYIRLYNDICFLVTKDIASFYLLSLQSTHWSVSVEEQIVIVSSLYCGFPPDMNSNHCNLVVVDGVVNRLFSTVKSMPEIIVSYVQYKEGGSEPTALGCSSV